MGDKARNRRADRSVIAPVVITVIVFLGYKMRRPSLNLRRTILNMQEEVGGATTIPKCD